MQVKRSTTGDIKSWLHILLLLDSLHIHSLEATLISPFGVFQLKYGIIPLLCLLSVLSCATEDSALLNV